MLREHRGGDSLVLGVSGIRDNFLEENVVWPRFNDK